MTDPMEWPVFTGESEEDYDAFLERNGLEPYESDVSGSDAPSDCGGRNA